MPLIDLVRMEIIQPSYANGKISVVSTRIAYGASSKDIDAAIPIIKNITATGVLDPNDKVFFTPWSEVPRYKFNEYAKDKPKLSRVITLKNATTLVLEPSRVEGSLLGSSWEYDFFKLPKTVFQHHEEILSGRTYDSLPDTLYVRSHHFPAVQALVPFSSQLAIPIKMWEYGTFTDVGALEERISLVNELMVTTKKLISDNTVLLEICQGVVISPDVYEQLSHMLSGNDQENIGLAMDLMANADYKKSELRLAFLLNRFNYKIRGHRNFALVNFKSLINYFTKYQWAMDELHFANKVVELSKSDEEDYQERIDMATASVLSWVNNTLQGAGGKFKVEAVSVK